MSGTVICDGESIIIEEVFNKAVLDGLRDSNISIGKLSASCSGILQPLDRATTFRDCKSKLKSIIRKNESVVILELAMSLENVLDTISSTFKLSIPDSVRDRITYGCLAVRKALNETITVEKTINDFTNTGWYPLSSDVMFKLCYNEIPNSVRDLMVNQLETDVKYFLEQGYLTEEQYEASGVPTLDDPTSMPRDQRAITYQRAVLLTHPSIELKRNLKLSEDLEIIQILNSDKLTKKEKVAVKSSVKVLENHKKSFEKKEEKKQKNSGKSKEEKDAEKAIKAEKTIQSKNKEKRKIKECDQTIEQAKKKAKQL